MAWTRFPGLAGKIFIPHKNERLKQKHHCENCYSCQWCDENRCRVCRDDRESENQVKDNDFL